MAGIFSSVAATDRVAVSGCLHLVMHQLVVFLCAVILPQALFTMHLAGNSIPGAQTFINGLAPYFRCPEQPRLAPDSQEFASGSQKPAPADNRSLYPQMAPDFHWGCLLYIRATYPSCLSHHKRPWLPVVLAGHLVPAALLVGLLQTLAWPRLTLPQRACSSSAFPAGICNTSCLLRQYPPL